MDWTGRVCDDCRQREPERVEVFDCLLLALCGRCLWRRTVPQQVKEKVAAQKEEVMRSFTNQAPAKKEQREFPPIHKLEVGHVVVAQLVELREGGSALNGKMVLDCVVLGVSKDAKDLRSIIWPNAKKLPIPPLATPFRLRRLTQGGIINGANTPAEYSLEVAETAEESASLWNGGVK